MAALCVCLHGLAARAAEVDTSKLPPPALADAPDDAPIKYTL